MNFSELCSEVYTITGRPDRVAETESAVRAATLKAHQSDYYWKDLYETGIAFDSSAYYQSLDYRALLPRYRALKYLRKYDYVGGVAGKFLTVLTPEQILDRYATEKDDVVYAAGAYLQFKLSTQEQYFLLGCYLNPDVTKATYTSWIAIDHPWCIIYDASSTVFKAIGKDEEAATYKQLVAEQFAELKISNITPVGY